MNDLVRSGTGSPTEGGHPADLARRTWGLVRAYPVPFGAFIGLVLGLVLTYAAHRPAVGADVWLITLVLGGAPLVLGTVRRIWRAEFASDIIATLAILAAIALDQPFAGAIIVLMQSGGEAIEAYAHRHATASLERLTLRAPRWAYRYVAGGIERIAAEEVRPGDRLAVRPGDLVPVDGRVASPSATLDESSLTGEPVPKRRTEGAAVASGTVNVGPPFDLVALRASSESQYARIVELVRTAQTRKPAIQRLADRYATWFTPTTVAIALLAATLSRAPITALAVLVVATPCPLILATPIAVLRGMDRASHRGIVVKSGAAMEEMGRAQVVLFDKTGTLTAGRPDVDRVVPLGDLPASEILDRCAALERLSSHPLAQALLRRAAGRPALEVSNVHEFPGAGVAGTIGGERHLFGARGLCESVAHRPLDVEESMIEGGIGAGRLVSYLLIDGKPVGAVLFTDPVRPEVRGLADGLRGLGIRQVGLLTGDRRANAEAVAEEAGISYVAADLLPEQKVERVGEFRRSLGPTIMVGDGINDAAALATASVGIAMGAEGAGIAAEAADAVLLVNDVSRVKDGVALGQRMLRVARQGIVLGLGTSLVLMGIACFGVIAPADGAIIQEALDVLVIFNAFRVT